MIPQPHPFTPAATLLRHVPELRLAATPAGSVVHVLNRPDGAPICRRDRATVTQLPADQPAPALRVCEPCLQRLSATVRVRIRGAATAAELTAVREHAARQRPQPLFLAPPDQPDDPDDPDDLDLED